MRSVVVAALAALLVVPACASTGGGEPRRDRDRIVQEEIEESPQFSNALELVQGLRPEWLRTRGPNSIMGATPIMVYVDGLRLGSPVSLRAIPRLSVLDIRFLDPPQAQARFGLNNTNGAIVLRTRSY